MIVEADGSQHADNARDEVHDAYLAREGWKVLRFWNHDLLRNRESVLGTILAHAGSPTGSPSSGAPRHLLPEGEGNPPL